MTKISEALGPDNTVQVYGVDGVPENMDISQASVLFGPVDVPIRRVASVVSVISYEGQLEYVGEVITGVAFLLYGFQGEGIAVGQVVNQDGSRLLQLSPGDVVSVFLQFASR